MVDRKLTMDVVGIGLGLGFAVWVGMAAVVGGGNPGSMIGLGLGSIAAVVTATRLARIHFLVVPLIVAGSPIVALFHHGSSLLGRGVLGYSNASASLSFIAACAAVTVALSVRGVAARVCAWSVAAVWLLVPLLLDAMAAAALGTLLPLAVVLGSKATSARRVLLSGAGLSVVALLTTVILGSVDYRPSQGLTAVDRWFEENLSEVRVTLWETALELTKEHPVRGVGPGNFPEASRATIAPADPMPAHNEYLQVAAESGVPAGFLLLSIVAWGFLQLWPALTDIRSVPAVVALSGVTVHANIDFIWHYPEVPIALALLVGAASAVPRAGRSSAGPSIGAGARAAGGATFTLGLFLLSPIEAVNPEATIQNGATSIAEQSGIRFRAPGVVRSDVPPRGLIDHLMAAEALTIELRATPYLLNQAGPARIVSISDGPDDRNLTLGQERDRLVFRLRTTRTDLNGLPQLEVREIFTSSTPRHLVVTTTLDSTRIFVDGTLRWRGPGPGGKLSNWNRNHLLLLGNETTGDRPWIGRLDWVALFDRAMTAEEVATRYSGTRSQALASRTRTSQVAALYPFEEKTDSGFVDLSEGGLGPPLVIPQEIPAPVRGPFSTILGTGSHALMRLATHSLLFGIWALFLLFVAVRRPLRHGLKIIVGGGAVVALGASVVRYLAGYSPAIWDIAGGTAGCAIALLLAVSFRRQGERPAWESEPAGDDWAMR